MNGQSSAKVLEDLRRSSDTGQDAVQSTTAVAMGCLEACGTGRYHDATVLSDSLVEFFGATVDPIAGSAGYYIRALTEFMRGNLDLALASVSTLQSEVPTVDWEQYGALASFAVLAYGVAVMRTADIQLSAMIGATDGVADRADHVVAALTELGIDQFVGGARLIRGCSRAVGPHGVDTVDEMQAALEPHGQGGRRIFSPLHYGLLCDATAMHRDLTDAQALLVRAETIAAATGERVWDAQLSARRLRLAARQRTEHRRPPAEREAKP